jgi:hypothetical protein
MLHASPSSATMRPADRVPTRVPAPQAVLAGGDRDCAARERPEPAAGNQALLRTAAARRLPSMLRPSRTPLLQRKCACGGSAGVSGECSECKEEKESDLHRKAAGEVASAIAPPIVHQVLNSPGAPLDAQTRAFMEPRFGQDLGAVRVHTGAMAAESAAAVNAHAFTVGRDIVFASGRHAPRTGEGRRLLAHELTHVVQQGASAPTSAALRIGPADDPFEREADRTASAIEAPAPAASTGRAEPTVQRQTPGETPDAPTETPAADSDTGIKPAPPLDPSYPPDKATGDRLSNYNCTNIAVDKTKPQTRLYTAEEAITVVNALDHSKRTIAQALSNLAQRSPFHLAMGAAAFHQPVTFEKMTEKFILIQNALSELKLDSNLVFGTCDEERCLGAVAAFSDKGIVSTCSFFFTLSADQQAQTILHESGHHAGLDPHFDPKKGEGYCHKNPLTVDCENVCPEDDGNMLENVDAWTMLAHCVATVARRNLDTTENKSIAVDLRYAQDLVSRAYGNLGRHDPYHLTLAQRTFGAITAAEVDAKVLAIKNKLGGMDDSDTTGATAGDAGARLGLIAYTLENGKKLVLCPGYFGASSTARSLSLLMHAGYKAGIAVPGAPGSEVCGPEKSFDCTSPCPEGLNPPDQTHVSDNKNEKSAGAWARYIACVGSG